MSGKTETSGFACPTCGSLKTHTSDSRRSGPNRRKRRRWCEVCGNRFTTMEITVADFEAMTSHLSKLKDKFVRIFDDYIEGGHHG